METACLPAMGKGGRWKGGGGGGREGELGLGVPLTRCLLVAVSQMGAAEEGLREAEAALALDPEFAKGWLMKAKALRQLGDVAQTFK